ncbi:uncharacterized protein LOC120534944 isoform X1 [Polypterus senegalus]|uniref:uncharacterized protein LOC120534944 isoform X1 n=2 Tax=Polypterus senegalus TaxID=55291 RepID=UPI0019666C0B|nr:uncharacterized protein LOC120534944 isoform X1 [Polypterus senegalus]
METRITLRKAYEETPMTKKSFTDLTPKSLEADSEQNDDIGFQLFAILEEIQSLDHMVRNLEDKKKCCQKMTSRLPEMTVETGRLECHIVESSEISAKLYTELGRVNGFKACECELKDVEELMQLILEEMCPKNTLPKIKDDQDEEECSEHFFPDVVLQVCIKDRTLKECLEIIFSEFEALKLYAERLEKDKEAIQIEKQHALKLLHDANEANLRMSEELCALKQQKVAAAVDLIAPDELQQDLENAVEAKLEEKEMNQKLEDMLVRITDTITVMYQTLKSIK